MCSYPTNPGHECFRSGNDLSRGYVLGLAESKNNEHVINISSDHSKIHMSTNLDWSNLSLTLAILGGSRCKIET